MGLNHSQVLFQLSYGHHVVQRNAGNGNNGRAVRTSGVRHHIMSEFPVDARRLAITTAAQRVYPSTPTRIRTWNAALEARHDRPFHHRGMNYAS